MQTFPADPEKIHRYPCIACGADLLYEPKDGFLSCPYCSHKEAIPTSAEQVEERSFEQYLQIRPEQLEQLAANALEVQCQSCGATVTFTPPEVARQCDFCGVQIVAQAKSADPILAPEGVLPFCITQPQASAGLHQWLQSRWLAATLEPWDLAELRPYDPAFLSGFKAQRYQVDLAQGFERVKQVTANVIQSDVRANIGGDEQRIHNISTHYSGITFKHLLLPVYA